jgi:DNA-binding response OmpR family regulator
VSLKILLADDSMTAQNMGKKILTDGGYDVVTVSNGAAAMKKLAEFTPDLIIADVYMPGYNGLEICERVKKAAATASVPVLLAVGKLEPFRPEEGLKVHADGVIIKPFEATDLLAVTAKLVERGDKAANAAKKAAADAETLAAEQAETPEQVTESPVVAEAASQAQELSETPAFAMEETPAAFAMEPDDFAAPKADAAPSPFAMVEPAAEHRFDLEETGAQASFEVGDSKPDYVREFGLDPHDAPTTMFPVSADYDQVPTPSFAADVPDFDEAQSDAPQFDVSQNYAQPDELVGQAPASLNFVVNEVAFAQEPTKQTESVAAEATMETADASSDTSAEVPEDDFEAKLAKAMAEYETTAVAEVEAETAADAEMPEVDAVEIVRAPSMALTVAAPTWVAEEMPVSATEMGLSLDSELRTFSAAAGAGVVSGAAHSFAPIAPIGETSIDDEVATLVEESKENFFPGTFTARVTAMVDQAGCGPAEVVSETAEFDSLTNSDEPAMAGMPVDASPAVNVQTTAFSEWPVSEEHAAAAMELPSAETSIFEPPAAPELQSLMDEDVPELITHDVSSEWVVPAPAEETAAGASTVFEQRAGDRSEMAANVSEDIVLMQHDFVSHEAPFAHAAVDEVAIEHLESPPAMSDAMASTLASKQEQIVQHVAEATPSIPGFDHATVADVVERVMERMKGEIVSQIARELAAKMGK